MADAFIFYSFATLAVLSAIAVISVRNPVRAALFLVLTFFATAAIWLLLEAEFLAITLVLVYVGAVMVLFLFVVMMLDINITRLKEGFVRFLPIGVAVAVVFLVMLWLMFSPENYSFFGYTSPAKHPANYSNTEELGSVLYTVYVYPFEIASVILLVAIVAAIALTLRRRPKTKYQDPDKQIAVQRNDRVRMVSMKAEKNK